MKKDDLWLLQYVKEDVLDDLCTTRYGKGACQKASPEYCDGTCLVGRSIALMERLLVERAQEEKKIEVGVSVIEKCHNVITQSICSGCYDQATPRCRFCNLHGLVEDLKKLVLKAKRGWEDEK